MTINKEDYKSRWDFMADRAGVPREYDKTRESDEFIISGTFRGEWTTEVEALLEKYSGGRGFNFLNKATRGVNIIKPYTFDMDKYDLEEVLGVSSESEFVNKVTPKQLRESRDLCPSIWKMIDWFGFKGLVQPKIHIQHPGQVFPYHFDDLTTQRGNTDSFNVDKDTNKYARIEVQLFNWDYGQVWGIGDTFWTKWEAGEIMWCDWYSAPHGTANMGLKPRICLQLTGEIDEEILNRLKTNNGNINLGEL